MWQDNNDISRLAIWPTNHLANKQMNIIVKLWYNRNGGMCLRCHLVRICFEQAPLLCMNCWKACNYATRQTIVPFLRVLLSHSFTFSAIIIQTNSEWTIAYYLNYYSCEKWISNIRYWRNPQLLHINSNDNSTNSHHCTDCHQSDNIYYPAERFKSHKVSQNEAPRFAQCCLCCLRHEWGKNLPATSFYTCHTFAENLIEV